ncbi:MAG: iron-containing alcohol dehydrogenase [Deltaproteobacteria bacterium]|nr:iron-containing alcohol dehydrogenase [Deltaproteobacteria bacterium]
MDLFAALGERIQRDFAGKHAELPQAYFWGEDAAERLAETLKQDLGARRVLVFSDRRTRQAGERCFAALGRAGLEVNECPIPDRSEGRSPVCDDETKERLARGLPRADVFVAVGAGVVNDLTKWLGAEASTPYVAYATAASMNGYTAANVAPSIKGVKSLFRAHAPRALAADPRVVASAPFALTSSGLGDVIAKPVSTADWKMNQLLFGEGYSESVAAVINDVEPRYLDHAAALARGEEPAIRALFDALVFSGCAMTLQGSSLPASGGEHLISHTLDMLAHVDGVEHDLHGRQVGVGTIVAAALYAEVLALEKPAFQPEGAPFDEKLWKGIAGAVKVEHDKKRERMVEACRKLAEPGRWESLRAELRPLLRSPLSIQRCLREAGAAHRFSDLGCTRERFLTALQHGAAIRGRFTSLDLAWATGVLPGAAERIVDEWVAG